MPFVGIVRDAIARLSKGEGLRSEIEDLVRDSQFLSPEARSDPRVLSGLLSSSLEKLQKEPDPCVVYDGIRNILVHLHRGRNEQDFGTVLCLTAGESKSKNRNFELYSSALS